MAYEPTDFATKVDDVEPGSVPAVEPTPVAEDHGVGAEPAVKDPKADKKADDEVVKKDMLPSRPLPNGVVLR